MEINKIVTGALDENCYVISDDKTCLVVDPGDDFENIKEIIGDKKVLAVLITHSHFDHIGALRNFLKKKSVNIFKKSSLEEKLYEIGNFKFNCIYTPGHSKDSVTFYFKEINSMFVGDFIFKETVGRYDLPGGNKSELEESLKKIKDYPEDVKLYPGHGDETTLKYELENNEYMK